jgi:crotonobetainyl-CoA:carnitine CoA-transferase CaiB-like acyl-CoA transferase
LVSPGLAGGVGPVHDTASLLTDPQVVERGSLVHLDGSEQRVLANPLRFNGASGAQASAATAAPPELGADTDAVLAAVGFGEDEIADLRAGGVLG